jgi:Glycosyl hydrolase family 26
VTKRTTTRFGGARRATARVLLPLLASGLVTAGATVLGGAAQAATTTETLTFVATDDAYSSSDRPTLNLGDRTKLVAGAADGDALVTYLKFKVSALPAGSTVQRVEINLHEYDRLPRKAQVARVAGTGWTEETLTNRNRPALGTVLSTVYPTAADVKAKFVVTGAVKAAGTYAFGVTSPIAGDVARYRAKEFGSNPPLLKITVSKPVTSTPKACTVDAKLVPSCNILWGAAAGGFSETPRDQALLEWEQKSGRTASVYHTYHRGDELFPTKAEIAMAGDPAKPRRLFINWKVNYGGKWADVARGAQDARIDRLAAHIKANYREKFFLTMHHEPENDVVPTAGSGMTATDFAAMFRYTVQRLRAQGVDNAVFVVAFMGIEKFYNQPWWWDLYPGDDVVDWIGLDAYVASQPGGYHYGTLTDLVNRTTDATKFPGFYNWHQRYHANKPLMLSEWGVHEYAVDPTQKAKILSTVLTELDKFPAIQAMFWFDTAKDQNGSDIRIDSSPAALAEFQKIAADPRFVVDVR